MESRESFDAGENGESWPVIPREEYLGRQERLREAIRDRGFPAAVIWSRGGCAVDMSADVFYLTNHYSQHPYSGDEAGLGVGRSHGVVVVPVEGPVTLIVDIPYWRRDLVVADDVRVATDLPEAVIDVLKGRGLAQGPVLYVGASYMTASAYLGLREGAPSLVLARDDRLVQSLRVVKSPAELEIIRAAAALGSKTVEAIMAAASVGVTEGEAVGEGAAVLAANGGLLYDAACASGPSSHLYTHERLPSWNANRRLRAGELFHVDCFGSYGGYYFDLARTRCVGDSPTGTQLLLLEDAVGVVEHICDAIKPGVTGGMLHELATEYVRGSPLGSSVRLETDTVRLRSFGHGLGLSWETPLLAAGVSTQLVEGMYLAVEMLASVPDIGGAMFEQNGIVGAKGYELLSQATTTWW